MEIDSPAAEKTGIFLADLKKQCPAQAIPKY
jgi:hypothetical protein